MSLVVTVISPAGKSQQAEATARVSIGMAGGRVEAHDPFDRPYAEDIVLSGLDAATARAALEIDAAGFDVVVQRADSPRCKRLLVADMDSTIIGQECIDELADFAGRKAEIAAITEAAMRGELDFEAALDARVAALAGLDASAIDRALEERVRLNPGARTLVATMKAQGARTVLISGGFTAFTESVAARAGFDRQVANRLEVRDGRLAGTVGKPIVDAMVKRATLLEECAALGMSPAEAIAIGDGANDIPMIEAAGLGLAFRAKPRTQAAADAHITDLRAALWAQRLARRDWSD